jgi:RNA polymerase sigma-70 factor (ECF subfamily)
MFRIVNETTGETTQTTQCQWTEWTDEDLLQEYRCTGVREAFDELVHRYERELYRYLYHILGNVANVEDVLQQTFMALLKECDKFEAGREFRPWLYRIAANKAVDYQRKAKRFSVISIDAPMGNGSSAHCIADTVVGNEPEPFEDPMDREIVLKVREAVETLPEQMKQAVYMVYFQGLSYREAADTVGVCVAVMSERVNKAVIKLNFMLKNVG